MHPLRSRRPDRTRRGHGGRRAVKLRPANVSNRVRCSTAIATKVQRRTPPKRKPKQSSTKGEGLQPFALPASPSRTPAPLFAVILLALRNEGSAAKDPGKISCPTKNHRD